MAEYLRLWLGPMQSMAVDEYLKPGRPANAVEAKRFVSSPTRSPG